MRLNQLYSEGWEELGIQDPSEPSHLDKQEIYIRELLTPTGLGFEIRQDQDGDGYLLDFEVRDLLKWSDHDLIRFSKKFHEALLNRDMYWSGQLDLESPEDAYLDDLVFRPLTNNYVIEWLRNPPLKDYESSYKLTGYVDEQDKLPTVILFVFRK